GDSMMRRYRLLVRVSFPLVVLAASTVPLMAGEPILIRQHPVSVRWGEVEVVETSKVKVKVGDGEQEFPSAVGLVFKAGERTADLDALLGGKPQAESKVSSAGSVYLAGRMEGGRTAWDRLVKHLRTVTDQ